MYRKALELDPDFAQAYVRIAICYMTLHWFHYDPGKDRLTISKEAIDNAFRLEPELPDAHLALACYYYWGFLNYAKAVDLMPIDKEAYRGVFMEEDLAKIYTMVGEYDEALKLIDRLLNIPSRLSVKLLKLDPLWKPLWDLPEFNKIISDYSSGN
jgi:tetratricopeptide (TPR) repeat protein